MTASATVYLYLNKRPQNRPQYLMNILNLFNISNSIILGCLLWQMLDPMHYENSTWVSNHPAAMYAMCFSNYIRICAYWLFVFQYFKIGRLLPVLIDIQEDGSAIMK